MQWNGVLAVDKPAGLTSRQVVDRVAGFVRPAKVGHAGTLDPLATGVLVIAVGSATRLISYIQAGRKHYLGTFRLGLQSDTDDIEGIVSVAGDWSGVTRTQLEETLLQFVGTIQQVPPQYSAVHIDGQRAYAKARRGESVDLSPRPVEVHSIQLTTLQPPDFELDLVCGSGTYVRSIGRDIGELLGCGAVMTALRRQSVGRFHIDSALAYDELNQQTLLQSLQSPFSAVAHLPRRVLVDGEPMLVRQGRSIPLGAFQETAASAEAVLVDDRGSLVAVAEVAASADRLLPRIVFPPAGSSDDGRVNELND